MSDRTKSLRIKFWIWRILSALATVGPMAVWGVKGWINGEVGSKVALGLSITVAVILAIFNLVAKHKMRCVGWILLLGIYSCLKDINTLLLVVALCSVLDDFLLTPMYTRVLIKYQINKEIDARG